MDFRFNYKLLFIAVLSLIVSPVLGWDNYNSASLETVAASATERFHVDLNWLSGDPTTETRVVDYLTAVKSPEEEKRYEAMVSLASEIERIARSQINGVINENEVERRSARAILDLILKHSLAAQFDNQTRARITQILEDAFALPEEHAIFSADLEIRRRRVASAIGATPIAIETAMIHFRDRLRESFMVPKSQRSNAQKFWNVTEEAFNQLERDCGEFSRCTGAFESEVDALVATNRITRTTANRLKGIFELRKSSLSTVRELAARGQNPIQEERISLSQPKSPRVIGLGYQAANTIAAGFIPSVDFNHPRNQKGLILILAVFLIAGVIGWRTAQAS